MRLVRQGAGHRAEPVQFEMRDIRRVDGAWRAVAEGQD
jgi:hypothetical protein